MKVLFLVSAGGEAMRRSVIDAITVASQSHEVRVLAPDNEGKVLRATGVTVESWRPAGLFNVLRSINALRHAVERHNPDVVHTFGWTATAVALGALPTRLAQRTLVTLQDPIRDKEMPQPFIEKRLPELLNRAGAIDAVYGKIEHALTATFKVPAERVAIAPYGVADFVPNGFARAPGRSGPIIGYSGRLEADRAWEVVLDALALLRADLPDAQVWFARTGPVHSLVRAHARGQRVLDAVTFFDDLPLAEFFTGIDLVAVPRTRDGVPYSLVEALVNGMPVVGSNSGGIADTLAPFSGWLVPDEAQSFAEGFRAAWADIDAAWNAAQAQRPATRAAFSPEKSAAHQLDTYARLVAVEAVSSASGGS